ncbi:MAG: DUF6745 domain-containing protein [Candidatus Humimicrobiaceae bacterium]
MITELNKKQLALIPVVRQEWLDKIFKNRKEINRQEVIELIHWLCGFAGAKNKRPFVIFVDSPLACQYAANMVKHQVWDQVRGQVSDQVWDQVRGQVSDQVESQELLYFGISYYGDISDYGWASFYDYFERIGLDYKNDNYNNLKKLITSGIFSFIPLNDFCIICPLPDKIFRLDEKLHSETGSAISWKDGYELFFLHGICFKKDIWEKIITKNITAKDILKFANIEQRMAALKFYGADNLLSELDAKLIDNTAGYELYKLDKIFSQPAYFLKYSCPSTGRVYVSGIDPKVGKIKDAVAACAWKFGLEKDQYKLAAES